MNFDLSIFSPPLYLFDMLVFLKNAVHLELLSPDSVVGVLLLREESEHVLVLLLLVGEVRGGGHVLSTGWEESTSPVSLMCACVHVCKCACVHMVQWCNKLKASCVKMHQMCASVHANSSSRSPLSHSLPNLTSRRQPLFQRRRAVEVFDYIALCRSDAFHSFHPSTVWVFV